MIRLFILLNLVNLIFGAPNSFSLNGRIVGGESVDITEFPYQVSIEKSGSHLCGGSIISAVYVITTARCTDGSSASQLSVRAGTATMGIDGTSINVKTINQHPAYNAINYDNDISILELHQEFPFDQTIEPVGLPSEIDIIPVGTPVNVSGWGYLTEGGVISRFLQGVEINIVDLEECRLNYEGTTITDRMICAGVPEGGKAACTGDSGGPMVSEGTLFGIVSWGYGCGRPGFPGVYTNVVQLRSYIQQITGI